MSSRLDRVGTWFDHGSRLPPLSKVLSEFHTTTSRSTGTVVAGYTGRAMCTSRQGRFRQHRLSQSPRPPLFARRLPDPHEYCCLPVPVAMAEFICWPSMPRTKPMVSAPAGQMTAFFLVTYVQYLFFSKLCKSPSPWSAITRHWSMPHRGDRALPAIASAESPGLPTEDVTEQELIRPKRLANAHWCHAPSCQISHKAARDVETPASRVSPVTAPVPTRLTCDLLRRRCASRSCCTVCTLFLPPANNKECSGQGMFTMREKM